MTPSILNGGGIVRPPHLTDYNVPGAFVEAIGSPWYQLVSDLHDVVTRATVEYASSRGLKWLHLPITTRTVTCAPAAGSDAGPVPVCVSGVDSFLVDSMQFALEYGCRTACGGCYTIMPSFRSDSPDATHLGQYTHSEAEIPGDLDDLIEYVEGYIRALSGAVLDGMGDRLAVARGDISHLQRVAGRNGSFEQISYAEAVRLVCDIEGAVTTGENFSELTRKGEQAVMEKVDEIVWVRNFETMSVPFYHAFADQGARYAANADLFFGLGEIIGSGERHSDSGELRKSMDMHGVVQSDYEWYIRMRDEAPMKTAGFGMGVDRFLMWVLRHDDIRDIPIISRIDEPPAWPAAVVRP
ncbi:MULTISPECIES: amino acid--tRNA ligase-related protein [unclassified Nocardia]|uniref:amino acid--tRNA ligase-related protein n=1 Tax=unclassified Nocardia TaxID=2637762 RepID=UPI001CE491EE|nr:MULTISPECIES: amino acid--tRNA ligase-related protein [unclassified Nocardia]